MRKIFALLALFLFCGSLFAQVKIKIDSDERLMGYYTTDELPDDYYLGWNVSATSTYSVANLFEEDVIGHFLGGDIMRFRFALQYDTYVYSAFVYSVDSQGYLSTSPLAEVTINSTLPGGWNDIELPSPVTIEEDLDYLIGYSFMQEPDKCPIGCDGEITQEVECDHFYYTTTGNWYSQAGYGAICLQAVVRGGSFAENDLALKDLSATKYTPVSSPEISYSFQIRSMGTNPVDSYSLSVLVDETEVTTLTTPIANLSDSYQTISQTLDVASFGAGDHELTVQVAQINGQTPTENLFNDTLRTQFIIYEGSMPDRQMHLIENFTSIYCSYCPLGHAVLAKMQEDHPDKYAWIAIHTLGMGADTLAISQDDYTNVEILFNDIGWPTAVFDRTALSSDDLLIYGQYCSSIGYPSYMTDEAAEAFDTAIDQAYEGIPAFATIDITPEYNADTRLLTITVSGTGNEFASTLLADHLLTIYITEDGIKGKQYDSESSGIRDQGVVDYTHNNVLRAIPTTYEWGDDILWTSSSTYTNTISTTIDPSWDDSQIYITAFISGAMVVDIDGTWYYNYESECMVNNVNRAKATSTPAGISTITTTADNTAVTYYSTDGRQLTTPTRGVNIVRYADGSTKKLLVK